VGQKEEYDKAYAQGRADAAKPGDGDLDAGKVLAALVTAGISAGLTGVTQDNRDPPKDEAAKAAYERGWEDERKK
jgi:sugar phosphate isomerase/epimerase